jgi:hypothetical protein
MKELEDGFVLVKLDSTKDKDRHTPQPIRRNLVRV